MLYFPAGLRNFSGAAGGWNSSIFRMDRLVPREAWRVAVAWGRLVNVDVGQDDI
jgi:hypothetical protein